MAGPGIEDAEDDERKGSEARELLFSGGDMSTSSVKAEPKESVPSDVVGLASPKDVSKDGGA